MTVGLQILYHHLLREGIVAAAQTEVGKVEVMLGGKGCFSLQAWDHHLGKFRAALVAIAYVAVVEFRHYRQNRYLIESNLIHRLGNFDVQVSLIIQPYVDPRWLKAKLREPLPITSGDVVNRLYSPRKLCRLQRESGERSELLIPCSHKLLGILGVVAVVEGKCAPRIGIMHLVVV